MEKMEVLVITKMTSPYLNNDEDTSINSINLEDYSEQEEESIEESKVLAFFGPIGDQSKYFENIYQMDLKSLLLRNEILPGFNINVETIDVVKFSSELLQNLNLLLNYRTKVYIVRNTYKFDETLSYNENQKKKFKRLVTEQDGYLENESNYFTVKKEFLSRNTKTVTLRNSRVILFWRKLELKDNEVKRILSLGLSFLIGSITLAELYFYVRRIVPKGIYEVSIRYKKNSYVLIGIEKPIFRS